jgi:uncharacterized protein (TIGR00251 family)
MPFYQWRNGDLLLNVRTQPRASSDGFAEVLDDRIKIRITAPPVDGKANRQLSILLADIFGVSRAQVSILSGETGRNKRILIERPVKLPDCITREPGD